ncbi:MAG: hypothetical protein Q9220_001726 [cf. Caloplaca sp. 1 TL-2023]
MYLIFITIILATSGVYAQSLLNATARYPQLSDFSSLLSAFPDVAATLLTNISSSAERQTILVPSNDAFNIYRQQSGASFSSLSSSDVGNILNYHTLQGALSSSDIQRPEGLVSNSALTNSTYADRESPPEGGILSQVVFISSTDTTTGRKIKARQVNALSSVDVRSGKGNEVELEPTAGNWSGGVFYVVNGFLTLPVNQTDTMTAASLTDFVRGLNRTNVTEGTNAAKGLTCLCPNNEAFRAIANSTGNITDGPASLLATLTRHGLTGSYYSTNFTDGDMIQSQNGYPILVTRRNGSIFLNDAQILGSNYIARTGAVHALDRIMGFLNTTTNITTPADAPIYSDQANIPSPTPKPTAATSSGGAIPSTTGSEAVASSTDSASSTSAASTTSSTVNPPTGAGAPQASATGSTAAVSCIPYLHAGLVTLAAVFVAGMLVL